MAAADAELISKGRVASESGGVVGGILVDPSLLILPTSPSVWQPAARKPDQNLIMVRDERSDTPLLA